MSHLVTHRYLRRKYVQQHSNSVSIKTWLVCEYMSHQVTQVPKYGKKGQNYLAILVWKYFDAWIHTRLAVTPRVCLVKLFVTRTCWILFLFFLQLVLEHFAMILLIPIDSVAHGSLERDPPILLYIHGGIRIGYVSRRWTVPIVRSKYPEWFWKWSLRPFWPRWRCGIRIRYVSVRCPKPCRTRWERNKIYLFHVYS